MSKGHITLHKEMPQGSDEWYAARCGILTASEMKHIITPAKLQYASNDKERSHLYELAAQRVTKYVDPAYISDDMLRGQEEEILARDLYSREFNPTETCGFITNDKWGFTIGFSPDALVGDEGLIECKSRRQKFQIETITSDEMPSEYMIQVQTGLLVSEREWCDFVSYSGGLPMYVKRVAANAAMQDAIVEAAKTFHTKLDTLIGKFKGMAADPARRLLPTERTVEKEMV